MIQVRKWEAFFNGPSLRAQLVSRYIFQDPDTLNESNEDFLARESRNLDLPAGDESPRLAITPLLRYSRQEERFLQAKQTIRRAASAIRQTFRLASSGTATSAIRMPH